MCLTGERKIDADAEKRALRNIPIRPKWKTVRLMSSDVAAE